MQAKIYTRLYTPFMMGGKTIRYISCEWNVTGPHDIGKGFQAYIAIAPSGKPFIVEATTGAIIGDTLQGVREDVAAGTTDVMAKQVADSAINASESTLLSSNEFWSRMGQTIKRLKE
jgi:hypothetical protein